MNTADMRCHGMYVQIVQSVSWTPNLLEVFGLIQHFKCFSFLKFIIHCVDDSCFLIYSYYLQEKYQLYVLNLTLQLHYIMVILIDLLEID